jgi:hypothetical protein
LDKILDNNSNLCPFDNFGANALKHERAWDQC